MKKTLVWILIWIMALAMLPVTAFAEDEDPIVPKNGIPLVIIRVDEPEDMYEEDGNQYGSITDMNVSWTHSVRCKGTIEFVLPEGYESEHHGTAPTGELELNYIRGRGNSTWRELKKPYKIKLAKRDDEDPGPNLFNMGESREWALMANARDSTLIKNRITSWLGEELGLAYTPQMVPVDVYMQGTRSEDYINGKYLGSYYLSELVQVEESRVNIETPKKKDTTEPNITGGYLISFYNEMQDSDQPESNVFKTKAGVELINEDPEYVDEELTAGQEAQRAYIKNYIQELEDLIMQPEIIDLETHNRIAEMMDLQSLADYWLIQEFSFNGDAFLTSSTYMYKERDGKLYWGPLWDFDIAWGVQDMVMPDSYYAGFNKTEMIWIDALRDKDQYFVDMLKRERWPIFRDKLAELSEEGGIIDQYKAELAESQKDDYETWGEDTEIVEDYDAEIQTLKRYINKRSAWMNENLDDIGSVYVTASFEAQGETVAAVRVRNGGSVDILDVPEAPAVDGKVFLNWYEQGTDNIFHTVTMEKDTVFEARYIDESEAIAPEALFFNRQETWAPVQYGEVFIDAPVIYPEEATSKVVKYFVSDESIASVQGDQLILHQTGDVVITARTYNGLEASYTLHVFDRKEADMIDATGIKAGPDITMKPGEMKQATYTLLPEGKPVKDAYVEFFIDDESVATIDNMGVVTALKPGTATITMETTPEFEGETYKDTLTLTVTDPEDSGDDDEPEKATYTITYDLNGGTLDGQTGVITEQHKEGEVITVKDAPTRAGYKFDYWEGSKLYPGDKYTVTEDHTLKAVWSRNSGSGTGSSTTSSGKTSGTSSGTTAGKTATSAKTGDHAEFKIWYLLMILSAATMLGVLASGKKRRA